MAFTRKSAAPVQRIEGEFPELPIGNELGLDDWWLDTKGVLNRVRERIDTVETEAAVKIQQVADDLASASKLKETLGVEGDIVGTSNEQEIDNKFIGGGSF